MEEININKVSDINTITLDENPLDLKDDINILSNTNSDIGLGAELLINPDKLKPTTDVSSPPKIESIDVKLEEENPIKLDEDVFKLPETKVENDTNPQVIPYFRLQIHGPSHQLL